MTNNEKTELKTDGIAPREMPSSDPVEKREYTIKVVCERSASGVSSCKIRDISIDEPLREQPAKVCPQNIQGESVPIEGAVVPQEQARADATPKDSKCDICEILGDMTRPVMDEKARCEEHPPLPAQGRRLRFENQVSHDTSGSAAPRKTHPCMRPRRMIQPRCV